MTALLDAWELVREAVLAGAAAGALLGALGVHIVLRRMVFLPAALSEVASLGVALSSLGAWHLGLTGVLGSPTTGAVAMTALATSLLLGGRRDPARRDGLLGMAFLVGAAGTLAASARLAPDAPDLHGILSGSAVAVSPEDLRLLLLVAVPVLVLQAAWSRGFLQASMDPDGAAVRGLPVRTLEVLLMASLVASISVATRVLGALPAFAFSVLPALAAVRACASPGGALAAAALVGVASATLGYAAAFRWELPVGASQTLCAAACVAGGEALRRVRRRGA